MHDYDIIIFGSGLSGLTLAHELVKRKFKILIVEKDSVFGGMAKSNIEDASERVHSPLSGS